MAIGRISTYALFQSTLKDAGNAQTDLFHLQQQLSSGLKSQNFEGIADQSQQFLDLEAKIARSDNYTDNNNLVQTRIAATNVALDQIINIANDLKNMIVTRRNTSLDNAAFPEELRGQWQALVGQLNSSSEGRYLFSGTKTDHAAVDATNFPTLQTPGVPDDSYYQGSRDDVTVRADDNIEFTYNVRADNDGFQKIFAGIAMAHQGDVGENDQNLAQAYDLVQSGLQDIISTQAVVNSNKLALDNVNDRHKTFKLYWQGVKEDIGNTDLVAVSTQVAINQGILQASFQAFAKINSLRLSDFLR